MTERVFSDIVPPDHTPEAPVSNSEGTSPPARNRGSSTRSAVNRASQDDLLQQLTALQQRVEELDQALCDRTQAQQQLEVRFDSQTEALRESNDTLIAEIVEHRQAELALRGAKDQLQAILDAVPGIVSWISDDFRYLGVNRHLAETFRMPIDAFTNQDIGFLHTSDEFNNFVKAFFASNDDEAYREVSANVAGVNHRFLIVAQKYNEGRAAFTVGIDITERNRTEAALRQAESKYRAIFENTVEGIFQTTPDGRYLSANPSLARIYGYESAEAMMANLTSIQQQLYVDSSCRDAFTQILQAEDAVQGFEAEVYRKDGSMIWISENARAVRDEAGTLLYYEGTVEDITDRKEAEAALQRANEELEQRVTRRTAALTESNQRLLSEIRERHRIEDALRSSEAELRALFAAMTDVITVFDAEGHYLDIVATNSELLYSPATERIGRTVYDVLPPHQANLFMRHIHQALNSKQPVRLEYCLPIGEWQGDGDNAEDDFDRTAWYTAIVSPMPDSRVIWVARDITERRRSDLALQQAEEKYRSIFENAAEGIFQISPTGQYLSVNPALARMCGYDFPLNLMTQVQDVNQLYVDPERRQEMLQLLAKTGSVSKFESRLYRADGQVIWVSENARTVKDEADNLLYYEGTTADITQRKQAEYDLQESQRALANLMGNLAGMAYRCVRSDDGRWVLAFVSEGCFELTGYDPAQILQQQGISFEYLTHEDDRVMVKAQIRESLRRHQQFQLTYRLVTVRGELRWVLEKGSGVFDPQGHLIAVEGFVTDITERKRAEDALQAEQEKSEQLLLNVLPHSIAQELKQSPGAIAYRFEEATILFADIVDFTGISSRVPPTELVDLLNKIFSQFDQLAERYGLEKIKTIGDAYMVVGGLPDPNPNHTRAIADMALEMQQVISNFKREDGTAFALRIGIDTGPVVAGVIGIKKFSYDLWGDAVNIASRMESQGVGGSIQVTSGVYQQLRDQYFLNQRGNVMIKGRGEMMTYWLMGKKELDAPEQ